MEENQLFDGFPMEGNQFNVFSFMWSGWLLEEGKKQYILCQWSESDFLWLAIIIIKSN